ncbi:hypothetical protein AVEN_234256-1 [Araneus ventricosus]|uniref:Uncharacterized protein n=1 Tax=Araneus ventricosus TaxID=182803 RepID=A0A4Y2A7V5_ARAVE|nr:hypothetical protein AVEN_234256-1 [Araneus ventricosus]
MNKRIFPENDVGHFKPASGTSSDLADCILKYLEDNDVGIIEPESIGFKGTATNTGWENGLIYNIELKIQSPLQWFICLLHFNELPFKHSNEYLNGETTSVILWENSKDQKYHLDIVRAIQTRQCPPDLAVRDPGPLSYSRWLTWAVQ